MAACVAHVHARVPSRVVLRLVHLIARGACEIDNEVVSNYIPVWGFGLVYHPGCYDISFVRSILDSSSVDVLSSVSSLVIERHVSVVGYLISIDGIVAGANHHVVNLKVICEPSADGHRLVQGIHELLP